MLDHRFFVMLSDAEKQDGDDNSNNEKVNEWCVVVCHMISNIQDKEPVILLQTLSPYQRQRQLCYEYH